MLFTGLARLLVRQLQMLHKNCLLNFVTVALIFLSSNGLLACTSGTSSTTPNTPGQLSLSLANANLANSESMLATITLSGASNVNNLNINISSMESTIARVSPASCVIAAATSSQNSCSVHVRASDSRSGPVTLLATTVGYPVQQAVLTVYSRFNASLVFPAQAQAVGVATPLIVSFNSQVESATIESATFKLGTTPDGDQIHAASITVAADLESATFVPESFLKLGTRYYLTLNSGIKSESGYALSKYTTSFTTQARYYTIFVATNNNTGWNGNLYAAASESYPTAVINNGTEAADALCQHDSQCQNGVVCKAMLVESSGLIRQAAPRAVNWVLQAYTGYKNTSGDTIGITGVNYPNSRVPALDPAVFTFNVESGFSGSDTTPTRGWTGMNGDWTSNAQTTCSSWGEAAQGTGNSWAKIPEQSFDLISYFYVSVQMQCTAHNSLNCAEQP